MKKIGRFFEIASRYSFEYALAQASTSVISKVTKNRGPIAKYAYQMQADSVNRYLTDRFQDQILAWRQASETAIPFSRNVSVPVWTCWLQGEDKAPEMVQKILAIQKNFLKEYDFHVVDWGNISEYIHIPGFVMDKFHAGVISPAALTDIIRCELLFNYGGIWLDSTILLTRSVPENVFTFPFYYAKGIDTSNVYAALAPETGVWESSFLCAQKKACLYKFALDCLYQYWYQENEGIIYYFLIHQIMLMAFKQVPLFEFENKQIPNNNISYALLGDCLRLGYDFTSGPFDRNTYVYKLSYKESLYNKKSMNQLLDWSLSQSLLNGEG